jgi:trigger factor
MQVSVESTGTLERRMTVTVPEERIATEVEQRLKSMAPRVRIDGFRPGKVPFSVIKGKYAGQVRNEVIGDVMQTSFYEAVQQEKLKPAGNPTIEPKLTEPGKGLEFDAVFEVMPEIKLAKLSKVKIERPVVEVKDGDIDDTIENIREQRKEYGEVDRAAENGDRVHVDFKGFVDGEAFQGGEAKDFPLDLGAGRMIKGFEEGIVGAKAGDELTLDLSFPEEYHAEELAGKECKFEIKVQKVLGPKLPEVDDEFAKAMGVEGGVEAMRAEIKKNMEREITQAVENRIKSQVMDTLLEKNDVPSPQAMIEQESRNLAQQMLANLQGQGMDPSQLNLSGDMYKEQAERRVKLGLLLSEIVQDQGLEAGEADVRSFVEELAAGYEQPQEVIDWYYGDKNRLAEVESLVLERKIVDWVLDQAEISDKPMSVADLMGSDK